MSEERQKEVGKFMASGLVATILDYALLNVLAVGFKFPLLLANSISAPISSYVSYKFNKHVVFEDRMHGRRKTLLLYAAILAFGILVIQNFVLYFANGFFANSVAEFIKPVFDAIGLGGLSTNIIAINFAKMFASVFSALWNYYMLRRFVFVTQEETNT